VHKEYGEVPTLRYLQLTLLEHYRRAILDDSSICDFLDLSCCQLVCHPAFNVDSKEIEWIALAPRRLGVAMIKNPDLLELLLGSIWLVLIK